MTPQRCFLGLVYALLLASCGGAPATPVATGTPSSTPRKVWLSPARVFGASPWFSDELTPIADATAELLARNGYAPIPNAELRALWLGVREGRLPKVAARCETPPPPALLARHVYADAAEAEIEVRCEKGACRLEIIVSEPDAAAPGQVRESVRYGMPLAANAGPGEWSRAIRGGHLDEIPPPEGGFGLLGALSGGTEPGVYVVLTDVTQTGPWATKLDAATFAPQKAALEACEKSASPWRDWWGQQTILEVDAGGHVGRCDYDQPDHLPPPEFACQCDVLRKIDFGPASAPRRAAFDLNLAHVGGTVATVRRATVGAFTASDRSAILGTGAVDKESLARCLAPVPASTTATARVEFEIGADGRVTHTTLAPIAALAESVHACLETALGRSRFNCPLSGSARVAGDLQVTVIVR